MAVFGVLVAPVFYRMVRSVTLGTRNELYVDAARVVGLSDLRIVGRHVLWAVPVIIQARSSWPRVSGSRRASPSWGSATRRERRGVW